MRTYGKKKVITFKQKIIYTVLILILFRLVAHIPLPFVNPAYVSGLLDNNGSLTFFNMLTGGSFEKMSILALGITPYITASIVIQLLGIVFPSLADMQKEGATGRKTIEKITIGVAAFLAFVEAICMCIGYGRQGLLSQYTWYTVLIPALLMTIGVFLLSWSGQIISERFFGNGISLILATGILASYLSDVGLVYEVVAYGKSIPVIIVECIVVVLVVTALFAFTYWLTVCEKRIAVTYSRRVAGNGGMMSGQRSVIPLKMVAGSVVPIIFASSIITLPSLIQTFTKTDYKIFWIFNSSYWFDKTRPWASIGVIIYCLLIIGFSYYYNQLNLNEVEIANNLRKHGGYINGIRPGKPTELYLKSQLKYLTLLGALGLCVIALVPNIVTSLWNISKLSFLGTSIIITVSVINETKEAFLSERLGGAYMQSSFLGAQDADSLFRFSKLGKKSEKGVQG